ncbi:hypothetical protein GIB67_024529 [Kingdonia uniflora]|uniref:Uncharacterized protein n=1 Tax=Kingdonia uniflora TaxID=39325 RepID=A0A7J7LP16_9MAGN|nr:hypothetical protein GIB67_024529 [Kingdonia uniflora]
MRGCCLEAEIYKYGGEERAVVVRCSGLWKCAREGDAASTEEAKKSNHVARKVEKRQEGRQLDAHIEEQFGGGRLLACIASLPGQCGRCDGYILRGQGAGILYEETSKEKRQGGCWYCCLSQPFFPSLSYVLVFCFCRRMTWFNIAFFLAIRNRNGLHRHKNVY